MVGGRSQKNKAHKTKFAAKSQRNKHREAKESIFSAVHGGNQNSISGAKAKRLLRNKQLREKSKAEILAQKRASSGSNSPPRVLLLIALSEEVDLSRVRQNVISACQLEAEKEADGGMEVDVSDEALGGVRGASGDVTVISTRYKLRLTILEAKWGETLQTLEAIKIADIIAFVVPTNPPSGQHVSPWGKECLSLARVQGLPSVIGFIQGFGSAAQQKKGKGEEGRKAAASALSGEFPGTFRSFGVDSKDECLQVLRHLSEHRLSPPTWRVQRPYLFAHSVEFLPSAHDESDGTLLVSGYIRGRSLSVNQIVHLPGHGDFHLSQIDGPEDPAPIRARQVGKLNGPTDMDVDERTCTNGGAPTVPVLAVADPLLQEPIVRENDVDHMAGEQTWPTEDELAMAVKKNSRTVKVPKGTSSYQAAWYIGNEGEDAEDEEGLEEEDKSVVLGDEDEGEEEEEEEEWEEVTVGGGETEAGASDDENDPMLTDAERAEDKKRLRALQEEDAEFPDEVDTPLNVPARQRFAKYRGLKSFRTSSWDPKESLPETYARIFAFENFKRTQKYVLAQADKIDRMDGTEGSVRLGTFVRLHLSHVSRSTADKAVEDAKRLPCVVFGLLKHETKMTVVHFGIRKVDSFKEPLRSKSALMFHCGFRRFEAKPIFSTDDLNLDKHKFERFLHPGRFSVASIFSPVIFPPAPLIAFRESPEGDLQLAASGSLRDADPDRIVLKKIVLSGFPNSVSKRKAVVKYMFFNPDDVRWFKPVELYTKYGRRGRVKEPVGDKGNMKCIFDGVVQQRDSVCMSLFKRVYPKWPVESISGE